MEKTMSANAISARDVARAKALLKMARQQERSEKPRRRGGTPSMNAISNRDIEQAKRIISMFDGTLAPATLGGSSISDRDRMMLEKSFLQDES